MSPRFPTPSRYGNRNRRNDSRDDAPYYDVGESHTILLMFNLLSKPLRFNVVHIVFRKKPYYLGVVKKFRPFDRP